MASSIMLTVADLEREKEEEEKERHENQQDVEDVKRDMPAEVGKPSKREVAMYKPLASVLFPSITLSLK